MTTPITSFARLARQARAFSVPLLAAGALAAGCGTASYSGGGPNGAGGAPGGAGGTAGTVPASAHASAPGSAPAASATAVPTVTGGPAVIAGGANCEGWPSNAVRGSLTAMFTPVAVERCVTSFKQIAGKGEWETATLERSTDHLATLTDLLRRPSVGHQPGTFCPEFVVVPPQIVLISSTGQALIPRLPIGACGSVDAQVLGTLAAMDWQPVSVRLVMRVSPAVVPKTLPGASLAPGSPTGPVSGVANGTPVH